jgi:hypothetical protein
MKLQATIEMSDKPDFECFFNVILFVVKPNGETDRFYGDNMFETEAEAIESVKALGIELVIA